MDSRLQKIQSNLNDSWLELANSDDDDDKGDPADADVSVKLLETDEGFTRVLKDFVTTDGRKESARSDPLSNLKVVIQWLLGHAREAEKVAQEACRVLRVYPFSFVARANLFYILWRKGDRAEAVDTLMPLVELWQRRPETYRMILCEGNLHTHTHTHTRAHMHTHTHTHTPAHARTHTHTHTHTTLSVSLSLSSLSLSLSL